jgi:molecular chaperone GrpE
MTNEQDNPNNAEASPGRDPSERLTPDPASSDAVLEDRIRQLEADFQDLNAKYLRTLADYQNSQRRAAANEREARQQGMTSVVLNVLTVMDHFDLALAQDAARTTAEQIVGGVKVIRDELNKVLLNHGVTPITPKPNEPFDPQRHQAVMRQRQEGIEPGRVTATLQAGYMLGDRVIRPAMVAVAPGEE